MEYAGTHRTEPGPAIRVCVSLLGSSFAGGLFRWGRLATEKLHFFESPRWLIGDQQETAYICSPYLGTSIPDRSRPEHYQYQKGRLPDCWPACPIYKYTKPPPLYGTCTETQPARIHRHRPQRRPHQSCSTKLQPTRPSRTTASEIALLLSLQPLRKATVLPCPVTATVIRAPRAKPAT